MPSQRKVSVLFKLRRQNGDILTAEPAEASGLVAALGIESVQHEFEVNGERLLVTFEFDPPLVPKEKPE